MRALLAYVLAISVLLGGGYIGLRWLFEPPNASFDQRLHGSGKVSRENKLASGKTDPNVAEQPSAFAKSEPLKRSGLSADGAIVGKGHFDQLTILQPIASRCDLPVCQAGHTLPLRCSPASVSQC
jgi:hypothetical protein